MTFQVPVSKASVAENRFDFSFPGSKKKYSIPLIQYLKPSLIRDHAEKDEVRGFAAILNEHFDEDVFAKFEDTEQFEAFIEAWKEASTISLGESEGSTDS